MNAEEALFDNILGTLLIYEKRLFKKLAKKILVKKSVNRTNYYGVSKYEYHNGTLSLECNLNNGEIFKCHISHPVQKNKRAEIETCIFDLSWLDANLLKWLNLHDGQKQT